MARRKKVVTNRIHTRKLDRSVAKYHIKLLGIKQAIKRGIFRHRWREFALSLEEIKNGNTQ